MTPSILNSSSPSYSSPMTVAQRKEANELRKTLKPLMEKRRRARINDSLNKLKALIVPLVGKDTSRYSKLEKADVLEMTVRFLRELPSSPAKDQADSFREGYKACVQRVSALLPQTSLDGEAGHRVNEFMQRALVSMSSACQHCRCGQTTSTAPQSNQRLRNLHNNNPLRSQTTPSHAAPTPNRQLPAPQPITNNMWRPW
ncbi:transcription factor HES-2-like [Hoplias malabaricus]|uniref:transcription factor HES-2-like n=1 Tax=Hoplias malabaricus TaxID=27720 RepID=UPI00346271EB